MIWQREPFYGGCRYYSDEGIVIVGYYSPYEPLEFEQDCKAWYASNLPRQAFTSASEAMAAAEKA
jgi:hypothetical protein